jgi:hypothetical protein
MKERSGSPSAQGVVADAHCIHACQIGVGVANPEPALLDQRGELLGGHIPDIALPSAQRFQLLLIRIHAQDLITGPGHGHRQRQAHVTQADHSGLDLAGQAAIDQLLRAW